MKIITTTGNTFSPVTACISILLIFFLFAGCNSIKNTDTGNPVPKAIVKAGTLRTGELTEEINLQAQSAYLVKSTVNAPVNCYIQKTFFNKGDRVKEGQVLFEIITKEARAAELSDILRDSTMKSIGRMEISCGIPGILTQVNKYPGDYVNEGAELCQISDNNSLVFILQVPFEINENIKRGNTCGIRLPDGRMMKGTIDRELDKMNPDGQTRQYVIKTSANSFIPEELLASVRIITKTVTSNQILPLSGLLADEMMHEFWVMKMINDSMAVKIPVKPGIRTNDEVEIKEPFFSSSDRILITGNYGLPDTAYVQIEK